MEKCEMYEAPKIELVIDGDGLEREVLYAGTITAII